MIPSITVHLSDEQMDMIESLMDTVVWAAANGKPGMLLAQVFRGEMKVFFADMDQAKGIQRAMGAPVGLTSANKGK